MSIDLTQVIVALIGLLAAIVTTVAVPLIKAKVGAGGRAGGGGAVSRRRPR